MMMAGVILALLAGVLIGVLGVLSVLLWDAHMDGRS